MMGSRRCRPATIMLLAVLLALARAAWATDTVTLLPSKDNTLYGALPGGLANGSGQHLFTGTNLNGAPYRTLIAFDIAGNLPDGVVIISVTLLLYMSRTISGPHTHTLHRVTQDWGEGTTDAPGQEGAGAPPADGDATWLHTFFNTGFWTNPGGDYVTTASASTAVSQIGLYSWSDQAMVSDVQDWLDNPAANFGWLLAGDEAATPTAKRFDSRDNPDPAVWPALTVEYELLVPTETSSWGAIKALYREAQLYE